MTQTAWPAPAWTLPDTPLERIVFFTKVSEAGWPLLRRKHWTTDAKHVPTDIDGLTMFATGISDEDAVIVRDEWIALLCVEGGVVRCQVSAPDQDGVDVALAELMEVFPASEASAETVPVAFWSYSPHGPRMVSRQIAVAAWSEIAVNYPSETRELLDSMMNGFRPSHGGQLVLWQGEPGTGKTHALRSLASQWRDWTDFHYIVDPEQMFGDHADYLLDVLLHESYSDEAKLIPKWRVLVLEDTGELLAADAKEKTGQALSRLLNTVDGMIGQGLKILVLVTTNEELKKLHPAVARPGRCAMQISFGEFDALDAREWAEGRGLVGWTPNSSQTLAELYAVADGYAKKPAERLVGFAR